VVGVVRQLAPLVRCAVGRGPRWVRPWVCTHRGSVGQAHTLGKVSGSTRQKPHFTQIIPYACFAAFALPAGGGTGSSRVRNTPSVPAALVVEGGSAALTTDGADHGVGEVVDDLGLVDLGVFQPPLPRRLNHAHHGVCGDVRTRLGGEVALGDQLFGQFVPEPAHHHADVTTGTGILGGGPIHEEPVQVEVLGDHRQVGADGGTGTHLELALLVQFGAYAFDEGVHVALGQGPVQAALRTEVPVQDRFADPGLGSDREHGRIGAVSLDHTIGGVQDGAAALGVASATGSTHSRCSVHGRVVVVGR